MNSKQAEAAAKKVWPELFNQEGTWLVSVGIGTEDDEDFYVEVRVNSRPRGAQFPKSVDGVAVKVVLVTLSESKGKRRTT